MQLPFSLCAASALALALAPPGNAAECPPPSGSVRVMLHDADVIGARLKVYANAVDSPIERVSALRKLFEAAACPQLSDSGGNDKDRSVECTVPGAGTDTIVVGVGQKYDSASAPPLLASLQEALAAAPRRHTFRWVAFSSHDSKEADRTQLLQKPKGAARMIDLLEGRGRDLVRVMVHVGPVGFGPVWTHPPSADDRLKCAFESAAQIAGVERGTSDNLERRCEAQTGSIGCEESANWEGGNDWLPFRRAGIPVFGVHSGTQLRVGARLDGRRYFATYRMLAIFLALADEALAPGATPTDDSRAAAATSGD